jgi:hypothetical protein
MRIERCVVGAALLVVAACNSNSAPTASTPITAPPASSPSRTVSGLVVEGSQPVQGAEIDNGPSSGVLSDSNGAFQLPAGASANPHAWVRAIKSGYAQPCAAPMPGAGPITVQLVSLTALTSAPVPSPAGFRTISGVILITNDAGPQTPVVTQPAVDAFVDFEPGNDGWAAAMTHSDNNGRFALCTLPETAVEITVLVGDTFAHVTVPPSETNIELTLDPGPDGRHR